MNINNTYNSFKQWRDTWKVLLKAQGWTIDLPITIEGKTYILDAYKEEGGLLCIGFFDIIVMGSDLYAYEGVLKTQGIHLFPIMRGVASERNAFLTYKSWHAIHTPQDCYMYGSEGRSYITPSFSRKFQILSSTVDLDDFDETYIKLCEDYRSKEGYYAEDLGGEKGSEVCLPEGESKWYPIAITSTGVYTGEPLLLTEPPTDPEYLEQMIKAFPLLGGGFAYFSHTDVSIHIVPEDVYKKKYADKEYTCAELATLQCNN
jgi:hypothetical protein